mmetsp:Transcript_65081/g.103113  ORF Transcript_65081/g.103113 Transcript_65081/m.103113 type:complete len:215 (-) Transcript_65081:500-1144(-)
MPCPHRWPELAFITSDALDVLNVEIVSRITLKIPWQIYITSGRHDMLNHLRYSWVDCCERMDQFQFCFLHWDFHITLVGRGKVALELHQSETRVAILVGAPFFTEHSKVAQIQLQIVLTVLPLSIQNAFIYPISVQHWLLDIESKTVLHMCLSVRINESNSNVSVVHSVPGMVWVEPSHSHPTLGLGTQSDKNLLIDEVWRVEYCEVWAQFLER